MSIIDHIIRKINSIKYNLHNRKYHLVSLGNDCFPRFVTVMYGIKPLKKQGELSHPFDLCVTPATSVNLLIQNDFKNYYNGLKYDDNNQVWFNENLGIYYNHDKDCHKKDLNKLKKRFRQRIKNFRNILRCKKHVYFIINNPNNNSEIDDIYTTLKDIRKNKPFNIIVLDIDNNLSNINNPQIFIFKEKHPFRTPNEWWIEENKEKCNIYLKTIGDYIKEIIEKDYKCVFYPKESENV